MNQTFFLLGFMGAGKSTIGVLLARELGLPFFDLDEQIVKTASKDIPTIFAEDGEPVFRQMEVDVLAQIPLPAVIALGGGAFMTEAVRNYIAQSGISIFLQWPLPQL